MHNVCNKRDEHQHKQAALKFVTIWACNIQRNMLSTNVHLKVNHNRKIRQFKKNWIKIS